MSALNEHRLFSFVYLLTDWMHLSDSDASWIRERIRDDVHYPSLDQHRSICSDTNIKETSCVLPRAVNDSSLSELGYAHVRFIKLMSEST